ncbi:MAG: ABC transporter permease, partial [Lachnospiraceae bacterium]|nr:ABC transporter permease [Lachnospiraceae bacterium]
MGKFILKRVLTMIPVLLGVSLLVFVVMSVAPGDPAVIIAGDYVDESVLEETRESMGLNDPLLVQWFNYVKDIVTKGDFGTSWKTGKSVTTSIFERYPTTVLVAILGAFFTAVLGVSVGIISAVKQYSIWDNLATVVGMLGVSMPNFFTGLVLVFFFSNRLKLLPASGNNSWLCYIMPIITIAFSSAASQMHMTRSSMLEVMRQDYIRTARAKGQSERKIILHHELKNAMIPIITTIGSQFGILLGGSMIVEQIFSLPGVGKLMMDSISYRDYPMVRGCLLLLAFSFCVVNLLVDIAYAVVD